MKLRLLPVLISIVVSSAVLFGGWFVYNSVAMENPLTNTVRHIEGVKSVQMDIARDAVNIRLTLRNDASLRDIYAKITKEGSDIIGDRKVNLTVNNESSPEIDKWWSTALFEVAQAMENKQYASIPVSLNRLAGEEKGFMVSYEMDDTNVYVRLTDGHKSKFIILPRTPVQLGVWPNEQ